MYTIYIYWASGECEKIKAESYEKGMEIAQGYAFVFGSQMVGYDVVRR